jgi:hypothetical protein
MAGSEAQQTHRSMRGATRRGGEKPRGRPMRNGWHQLAEGVLALLERTRTEEPAEGHLRRIPREEDFASAESGTSEAR